MPGRNLPPAVGRLLSSPGVYRFRALDGRVLYIGRATSLRSRVASYWSLPDDRGHLAPMVARIASIEAVGCGSVHEAGWLERNLLEESQPRWNRTPGGQESAVYIRLDARPSQPGLSVSYQPQPADQARYFGPYLGGLRVRQAVAALHRIAPLRYAGARLRGAERDMARVRGVGHADRGELVALVAEILERRPATVSLARQQLEQLRDGAAANLAYELAAQIQAEITALNWISSVQRVTTMAATNRTIAGWSCGTLVRFLIRDGRLNGWSQRACGLPDAADAVAATPADWRDFTQLNAELAASLAQAADLRVTG